MYRLLRSGLATGCVLTLAALSGCVGGGSDAADPPVDNNPGDTTETVAETPPSTTIGPSIQVDLSYEDTIEVAFAQVEAFWAEQMPTLYDRGFEPVAERIPYRPSQPESLPSCGGPIVHPELFAGQAMYCEIEDHIAWDDEGLFPDTYATYGDVAVAVIIAHEYAHAVQHRLQIAAPSIIAELQADCLAGAWTGTLTAGEPGGLVVTDEDLANVIGSQLRFRDTPGTPAAQPGAHGSGFDRLAAFADGYNNGPATCAVYVDEWPEIAELLYEPGYGETGGNTPLDELILTLIEDLGRYWTTARPDFERPAELHGFTVGDLPVRCGDVAVLPDVIVGTAYYCPADNTIEADSDAQRATSDAAGDAAATYGLLHAYAQAVVTQTTDVTDPKAAVLAADCLAGVWARDTFDDLKAYEDDADYEPSHLLWFSAGDLDEILVGITLTPALAPGAVHPGPIGPFDRTDAFGDGFFGGPGECTTA